MNKLVGIVLIIIIISASCEEDESNNPSSNHTPTNVTISQPTIDTSDLHYLPSDTGGIQEFHFLENPRSIVGYYSYLPSGYDSNDYNYPMILFLHGWGIRPDVVGDSVYYDRIPPGEPPGMIQQGNWNPEYPFVVISGLLDGPYWPHQEIHDLIALTIEKYRINTDRIYLTGLSLGGGGCWYYVGERGSDNYAAAIVPISARGEWRIIDNLLEVPIWAFHGEDDSTVPVYDNYGSAQLVDSINARNPVTRARVTVYPNVGHNAWTNTYNSQYVGITDFKKTPFEMSIYDWMLQYKKN